MSNDNNQSITSIWSCISVYFNDIFGSSFYENITQYTRRLFCVSEHHYSPLNEEVCRI